MNHLSAVVTVVALVSACTVLGQKEAQKRAGTHYSAAFIKNSTLFVFPFDASEVRVELPAALGAVTFSRDGRTIYGTAPPKSGAAVGLVAVSIRPSGISALPDSNGFSSINGLAVTASGGKAIVSARYIRDSAQPCGLFGLDLKTGEVAQVVGNIGGQCEFLSSWSGLSASPDGRRVVGTAKKGQLGVVNLDERRIEKLWSGTAASWSPDGKWIATVSFAVPMQIELLKADDFSVMRNLGNDDGGQLQWSPDSRYLLLWTKDGSCGLGSAYFGTLQAVDIETGQRLPVKSSKCRVNLMTTGWVSDDVLK